MKLETTKAPVAETEMLIRKPVAEVFEAFIDPDITTNFWFTKSSGRLEVGREITWDWEMYGVSTSVLVKAIDPDKRILIEWDGYSGRTTVEWVFSARVDTTTYVVIKEYGWTGTGDELVKYVRPRGSPGHLRASKPCSNTASNWISWRTKTRMRIKKAGGKPNGVGLANPVNCSRFLCAVL